MPVANLGRVIHNDENMTHSQVMALYPMPNLLSLHGYITARTLRALADRAERGELLGAAVVVWTAARVPEMTLAGLLKVSPHTAHFAVSRMLAAMLYPEEG